jgi:hypothetical protein
MVFAAVSILSHFLFILVTALMIAIGTVCLHYDTWNYMVCIDALGVTATGAYPSTATGFVPSSTPAASTDNAGLLFSPEQAWNKMADSPSCAISSMLWTTSTINASISFNYTGTQLNLKCPNLSP